MEKIKKERKNKKTKSVGNGEGSLYWSEALQCYIYQYIDRTDGKRKTMKQKKNEGKGEFKKRVTKLKEQMDSGTYIGKSKDTLYQILERHIEQKHKDGITMDSSYLRDTQTLNALVKCCNNFINKPIQKVTVENIEDSKESLVNHGQSDIDKMWRLLTKGFTIAYSRRKIAFNLMHDATLTKPISKKEKKRIYALTQKEEEKLNNILDNEERNHKYRNIIKMQLLTGMRIGEILARSISNYDNQNKMLLVDNTLTKSTTGKVILGKHTKTYDKKTCIDHGKRELPLAYLNSEVEDIIIQQISNKLTNIYGLLFWDYENNTFISYGELNSWLKRINLKYAITNNSLSTHVLRHTFITRLREAGVDMKIIQYIVGHVEGSPITDNVYTSVSNEFVEKELKKAL